MITHPYIKMVQPLISRLMQQDLLSSFNGNEQDEYNLKPKIQTYAQKIAGMNRPSKIVYGAIRDGV